MSAYEALAASYDGLTGDVDYPGMLAFLEALLGRLGRRPETVVDLACGTGSLSVLLSARGYRVTGVDCSSEMLTEAYGKAMLLEGGRPMFVCQRMERLELPEPVDCVVCCLDSLNYVTDPADCRETFRRVFESLRPGGVFLFDINTPEKLRSLDGQVFLDENDAAYCVWRAEFEAAERRCYYGIDLFQREGSLWRRSFEEHVEYAYEPAELTEWLRAAGFADVQVFGDRRLAPPEPGEQRVYFTATRE